MKIGNVEIEKDKLLHFGVSAAIVLLVTFFAGNVLAGIVLALVAGLGKELFDLLIRKTEFSWDDVVADILGIIVGAGIGLAIGLA
jgi:hypothetical protein